MICDHDHAYNRDLNSLPENQGKPGRHLCAGCAFEEGFWQGRDGLAKSFDIINLNEGQRGAARHKDVQAAFDLGYAQGAALRQAGF